MQIGVFRAEKKPCKFGTHLASKEKAQEFLDRKLEFEKEVSISYDNVTALGLHTLGQTELAKRKLKDGVARTKDALQNGLKPIFEEDSLWFGAETDEQLRNIKYKYGRGCFRYY